MQRERKPEDMKNRVKNIVIEMFLYMLPFIVVSGMLVDYMIA